MSTIFRAAAVDRTSTPATGPLVRGFVWSPAAWTGEPEAVEAAAPTAVPDQFAAETPDSVAARAETEGQTPTAVVPAVSSSLAAPPVQRQPETAAAAPLAEAPLPAAETAVPASDLPGQPPTAGPLVATSSAAQPAGERPEPPEPVTSPAVAPQADVSAASTPPPVQREPASAATNSPSTPSVPTSPSTLGRIWQHLGGLVTRSQPPAVPSQPEPVSAASATEMPTPAEPALPTAVSPSETDISKPVLAAKPLSPAPVQEPAVANLPETSAAVQRQPEAEIEVGHGLEHPPVAHATPSVQSGEAASAAEAPQMGAVPQPAGTTTTGPVAPAAAPELPTAVPSPATTPIQRMPVVPTKPTAVPPPPASAAPVPPASVMPLASGPVQRQPETVDQPPASPVVPSVFPRVQTTQPAAAPPPAAPAGRLPTAVSPAMHPAMPAPQPTQPAITPSATLPLAAVPPTAVQRQPESEPPPSEEDRNWQRLETIMRRHKEQEAAAEEAGITADSPTNLTRPSTASVPPIAPSFAKPPAAPKPAPGVISRQPAVPPREAPMVAVARGRGSKAGNVETAPGDRESSSGVADETVLMTTSSEAADETTMFATPLEAVWPVQSVEPTVQRQETAPVTPSFTPPVPSPAEPPVRPPTPQDSWVQERLSAVPPGMPTDSSVPLLRPRRPRPGGAEQVGASVLAAPAQAKMADTAVSADPLSVAPVMQRQPEQAEPVGGLVPTEIGGLPPDLWTLIGQPAPVVPTAQPQTTDGGKTVMAKRDGEGATAPLSSPETSALAAPDLSEYIQREPEEEEAESRPQATDAPLVAGGEEAEEKKEEEEVDINELARQVYAHIRGQLAVDKERERGRLRPNW